MGVWGAIANKMGASQETFLWVKITKASYQIIKWYVPKKKASYLIFYESLYSEIGKKSHWYMGVWGDSPQKPAPFQRIR